MFWILRFILKRLDADRASRIALGYFKALGKIPGGRFISRIVYNNKASGLEREVFGLQFYNPLGLGAGLDLYGDLYNDLNDLGFSFSEIGPMGSEGVRNAVYNLQKDPQNDILAVCLDRDWLTAFTLAYDFFDFFVIDFSREVRMDELEAILDTRLTYTEYKPVVVKLPEQIDDCVLESLADYCMMNGIDGIQVRSMNQIVKVKALSLGKMPLIANCHTQTLQEAQELLDAGASLIEIRTGLIYEGPSLISNILKYLEANVKNSGRSADREAA